MQIKKQKMPRIVKVTKIVYIFWKNIYKMHQKVFTKEKTYVNLHNATVKCNNMY